MATVTDTDTDRSRKKKKMIDLHCHILPGIDDGAKNIEESVTLLKGKTPAYFINNVYTSL